MLRFVAFKPLKSHVVGFGRLGGHGAHDGQGALCGVVVSGDRSGMCLRMAHLFQGHSTGEGTFASMMQHACFGP